MRQRVCTPTTRYCTGRKIGPVVVADEASRRVMEAADVGKKEGIVLMPTTVPDPPEARGFEAAPRTGKGDLPRNVGIEENMIRLVLLGHNRVVRLSTENRNERECTGC